MLEVDEGDPFNKLLHAKSINNLKARNIFQDVKSKIIDTPDANLKNIDITVEEKATGEILVGAGVGSEGGTAQFSVSENNFLGKGVKLSTGLRISEERLRGNFTVTNPNFNYSDKALSTDIFLTDTDKLEILVINLQMQVLVLELHLNNMMIFSLDLLLEQLMKN